MIKEEFGLGATVEEATEQAIAKLNCGDADYKIDIIEDYKPKVLGLFGGHPAKVRAYYECPDEVKPAKKNKNTKKNDKPKTKANKPEADKKPAAEAKPADPMADILARAKALGVEIK